MKMDVLTFETCWAVNSETIKQATSSWSIFTQGWLSFRTVEGRDAAVSDLLKGEMPQWSSLHVLGRRRSTVVCFRAVKMHRGSYRTLLVWYTLSVKCLVNGEMFISSYLSSVSFHTSRRTLSILWGPSLITIRMSWCEMFFVRLQPAKGIRR